MEQLNQVRDVLVIEVLHSFVYGVLAIALPLMMKDRDVDIVVIGFVFASMPLIMQFGRMFFATFSDFWGRKPFFVSNGVLGVICMHACYMKYVETMLKCPKKCYGK